jgi:hypothetical protein
LLIHNCFGYNRNPTEDHEQLFADFFQVFKIQEMQISGLFICSEDSLTSAQRHSVFGYPKQRATVSVGSVLKRRARPQQGHNAFGRRRVIT